MTWELPEWVWPYSAYDHVEAYGEGEYARRLGMHLSSLPVWKDLDVLRMYGNSGCHASWEYLWGANMPPSPDVVVCVIRVVLSFTSWYRRISMTDTTPLITYRSKL